MGRSYVGSNKVLQQLEIFFLFMHADGEASSSEMEYLNDIVTKKELYESDRQEFQSFCGEMTFKLSRKDSDIVIHEINKLLGEKQSEEFAWKRKGIDDDKKIQVQTIWTLINLGYADEEYSEAEKKVVEHLIERWEIDPVLVYELKDTADTILALTMQKNWIQTTSKPYVEIDRVVKELDQNIALMFKNVEITISEANIA